MDSFTIRQFTPQDIPEILQCRQKLIDVLITYNPQRRKDPDPRHIDVFKKEQFDVAISRGGTAFVAIADGKVVGYTLADILPQKESDLLSFLPAKEGEIIDIYVDQAWHGKHIGRTLLAETEAYLKSKGCTQVLIEVLQSNDPAFRFYKDNGYLPREVYVMKTL